MSKRNLKQLAAAIAISAIMTPAFVLAQGSTGGSGGTSSPSGGSASTGTSVPGGAMPSAGAHSGMAGGAAHAGGEMKAADKRFMMEAAMSDMLEIKSSQMALQKGQSAEVKQYAQKMIDDHTKTTEQLKTIAAAHGMTLPDEPDRATKAKLEKLAKAEGAEFDREYMKLQRANHAKAEKLFEKHAKARGDSPTQQFAQTNVDAIRSHHAMAKDHHQHANAGMRSGSGSSEGAYAAGGTKDSKSTSSGSGAAAGAAAGSGSGSMSSGSGASSRSGGSGSSSATTPPRTSTGDSQVGGTGTSGVTPPSNGSPNTNK